MDNVLLHRSHARKRERPRRGPWPKGYGLLLAAAVSIALWGGIIWTVAIGAALVFG
jgi:hypothetical protein